MSDDFQKVMQEWLDLSVRLSMRDMVEFSQARGISFSQINTLFFLHRQPRATLVDLSHHLGVTTPAVSQLIDRMVEMGLVSREMDPNDRRSRMLSLTELGWNYISEAKASRLGWLTNFTNSLTQTEKDQFYPVIARMVEKITPMATRGKNHLCKKEK